MEQVKSGDCLIYLLVISVINRGKHCFPYKLLPGMIMYHCFYEREESMSENGETCVQ